MTVSITVGGSEFGQIRRDAFYLNIVGPTAAGHHKNRRVLTDIAITGRVPLPPRYPLSCPTPGE